MELSNRQEAPISVETHCAETPRTVALEILRGCNLGCIFCYLPEAAPGVQKPLVPPISVTFEILDAIAKAGTQEVYILGGEPTLHPQFDLICQRIAELGFLKRGLVTNGTLLTRERARGLKRLGFWVDVSVRSVDKATLQGIVRRPNTLGKVLNGLRLLDEEKVPLGIEIDCLPVNRGQIVEIVRAVLEEGILVDHVLLHRIAPYSAARADASRTTLEIADYRDILIDARVIHEQFGVRIGFEDGLPLCLIPEEAWGYISACECGHTLATVDPSGNVRRCACHPQVLGNLLHVPLERIWRSKLAHFRSGDWLPPACSGCAVRSRCKGGCAVSAGTAEGYSSDVFSRMIRPIHLSGGVARSGDCES